MSPKLITVYGATGAQGSSVLRSLAANSKNAFNLRGITRNPDSDAARKLSSSGVEVVKADGWDKSSLVEAFQDSWGVFVNTNSDDPVFVNPEETRTELDLGKIIVDAAVEAKVEVFVYSGMASARVSTKGKLPVTAFDDKNAVGNYAESTGAFRATSIVSPGWYHENFLSPEMAAAFGGFPHAPADDGTLVFRTPRWGGLEDVPFISMADDYGDMVHGVFLDPRHWNGKLVQGVSHISTLPQVTKDFEEVTGKKACFEEIPWQDLDTYGVHELETVKLIFAFCQESGGLYFGVKTNLSDAAELKKKAAEACGKSGSQTELLTLRAFFKREFSG